MAIVPPDNAYALLTEVNGLLDKQNIAEESLDGGLFEEKSISGTRLEEKSVADSRLEKPVIAGIVKANGEKESGEGFTCEKTATGEYKVILTTELATLGAMVVTPSENFLIVGLGAPSKKTFAVAFITAASIKTDAKFPFMIKAT